MKQQVVDVVGSVVSDYIATAQSLAHAVADETAGLPTYDSEGRAALLRIVEALPSLIALSDAIAAALRNAAVLVQTATRRLV